MEDRNRNEDPAIASDEGEIQEAQEIQVVDEGVDDAVPFRYSITSYGADYPVDSLVKRLDEEVIFVPAFQRSYVWPLTRASRFIESLLLGLPVPGIFLSKEPETGKLVVIDGQQRLKTLQFFYRGLFLGREFLLTKVQPAFESKSYRTLREEDRRRLDDSILHATIVRQDEPSEDQSSIFHIFERLNTGGLPLQPQEIRACIFYGPFTNLLRELNNHSLWRQIYGNASPRLKDQELILRFFALVFFMDRYEPPIKEFLNEYMGANRRLQLQDGATLTRTFEDPIRVVSRVIGSRAFRLEQRLNAAAFDAIMVGLSRRLQRGDVLDEGEFRSRYDSLFANSAFLSACKTHTSDKTSIRTRLALATEAFQPIR